jgi:hypothetical protein
MIVTTADLAQTELYPEIIDKITRANSASADTCISEAESMARSYMGKYDIDAIFGDGTNPPTYTAGDIPILKKQIKIIASYYLVRKANPNINIELFKSDHDLAIDWLKDLQAGKATPLLPYKPDSPESEGSPSGIFWTSGIKRTNAF